MTHRFVHQELENEYLGIIIKIHTDGKVTLQTDETEYDEITIPASTIFKARDTLSVTRAGDGFKPLTVKNHDVMIEIKPSGDVKFERSPEDVITVPNRVIYKAARMLRVTKSIEYDND